MHELKPLDCCIGGFYGFKTAHRIYLSLEFAIIGFNNVIQVLHLPAHRIFRAFAFFLQFINGGAESRCLICIDGLWVCSWFNRLERFAKEPFRRFLIAGRRQIESNCVTTLVDSQPGINTPIFL